MDTLTHPKTPEQEAILAAATGTKDNLLLQAYAGTGKTSTLEMIEHAIDARPVLYLCFNKKIAEDAAKRMLSTTTVRTFNSMGHRVWAKSTGKNLTLDSKKSQTILRGIIDEIKDKSAKNEIWACFWDIVGGIALAKALGYVPDGKFPHAQRLCTRASFHSSLDEEPDDLTSDLIDTVLLQSITAAYTGLIDYNDQVYMPAVFGGTFPRFPIVMVDEAQDLSPANHAMLTRLVKGRIIAVGDPFQAIYQFRGAMANGMGNILSQYGCGVHDLSVSFRCPSEIVKHVQWRVPGFRWSREGGSVECPVSADGNSISDSSTILCRNNSPLFKLALHLLSHGRGVSVAGSDIGPKLIGLMKKLGPEELNRTATLSAIEDWKAERLDKGSSSAEDLAACMVVFANAGDSLGQAIRYAEHVLAQKGSIRLMTGHKAKGLEFDHVIHLDPWLVRKGHAGAPPSEQDLNLDYVISTRSRDRLVEIDSTRIRW